MATDHEKLTLALPNALDIVLYELTLTRSCLPLILLTPACPGAPWRGAQNETTVRPVDKDRVKDGKRLHRAGAAASRDVNAESANTAL